MAKEETVTPDEVYGYFEEAANSRQRVTEQAAMRKAATAPVRAEAPRPQEAPVPGPSPLAGMIAGAMLLNKLGSR